MCVVDCILTDFIGLFFLFLFLFFQHNIVCEFIGKYTDHVEGVGDICSFARFDFERFGDPMYANYGNIDDDLSKRRNNNNNGSNINGNSNNKNNDSSSENGSNPKNDGASQSPMAPLPGGMKKQISDVSSASSVGGSSTVSSNNGEANVYEKERGAMNNGKLENSFLTFAVNNPNWQANPYQTAVLQTMTTSSVNLNINNLLFQNNLMHPQTMQGRIQQQQRMQQQQQQLQQHQHQMQRGIASQGNNNTIGSGASELIHDVTIPPSRATTKPTTNPNNNNNTNDNNNDHSEKPSKEQPLMSNIFPSVLTPPNEDESSDLLLNQDGKQKGIPGAPGQDEAKLYVPLAMERVESNVASDNVSPAVNVCNNDNNNNNNNRNNSNGNGNSSVQNSNYGIGRSTAQLGMSFSALLKQQAEQQRAVMASIPSVPSLSQINMNFGNSNMNMNSNLNSTITTTSENIGMSLRVPSLPRLGQYFNNNSNNSNNSNNITSGGINSNFNLNNSIMFSNTASMMNDDLNNIGNINSTNSINRNRNVNETSAIETQAALFNNLQRYHTQVSNINLYNNYNFNNNNNNNNNNNDGTMSIQHSQAVGMLSEIDESVNERSSSQNIQSSRSKGPATSPHGSTIVNSQPAPMIASVSVLSNASASSDGLSIQSGGLTHMVIADTQIESDGNDSDDMSLDARKVPFETLMEASITEHDANNDSKHT